MYSCKYEIKSGNRVLQGDILESLEHTFDKIVGNELETVVMTFPYALVLTQDCDLESDFDNRADTARKDNDKYLQSILICPAYLAESLKQGKHLEELELKMASWSSDLWKPILRNHNERFHFLPSDSEFSIPDLILDFKHFYTVPRDDLYAKHKYKASVAPLFREHISQRFSNYLSRIGLPIPRREQEPQPATVANSSM